MLNKIRNSESTTNKITANINMLINPKNTSVSNVNKLYKNITKKLISTEPQIKLPKPTQKILSSNRQLAKKEIITNCVYPKTSNYAQNISLFQKKELSPLSNVVNNFKNPEKNPLPQFFPQKQKISLKKNFISKKPNILQKTLDLSKKPLKTAMVQQPKNNIKNIQTIQQSNNKKSPAFLKNLKENISVKTPKNNSNINISPNINVELKPQNNTLSDFNKIWTEIGNRLNSELNSSANGFH